MFHAVKNDINCSCVSSVGIVTGMLSFESQQRDPGSHLAVLSLALEAGAFTEVKNEWSHASTPSVWLDDVDKYNFIFSNEIYFSKLHANSF